MVIAFKEKLKIHGLSYSTLKTTIWKENFVSQADTAVWEECSVIPSSLDCPATHKRTF